MIAPALRRIERELDALVQGASNEHAIDPHTIHIIARQVAAQAEMLEKEIAE